MSRHHTPFKSAVYDFCTNEIAILFKLDLPNTSVQPKFNSKFERTLKLKFETFKHWKKYKYKSICQIEVNSNSAQMVFWFCQTSVIFYYLSALFDIFKQINNMLCHIGHWWRPFREQANLDYYRLSSLIGLKTSLDCGRVAPDLSFLNHHQPWCSFWILLCSCRHNMIQGVLSFSSGSK